MAIFPGYGYWYNSLICLSPIRLSGLGGLFFFLLLLSSLPLFLLSFSKEEERLPSMCHVLVHEGVEQTDGCMRSREGRMYNKIEPEPQIGNEHPLSSIARDKHPFSQVRKSLCKKHIYPPLPHSRPKEENRKKREGGKIIAITPCHSPKSRTA